MSDTTTTRPNALRSQTFLGMLTAQFFGAFNDQALHVSAMFFAINKQALSERDAISLMPILFYAPWAIFCTLAGYLADRYSKRYTLIFWKLFEIVLTSLAALGFWLGRHDYPEAGPWIVLAAVFLMGMQSAFFVPAKYGVMPEILPPEQLSRGNGWLESLSFMAIILGTIFGGVMSYLFLEHEIVVGLVLLALSIVGAVASLFIKTIPPANPDRPFPKYIYGPLGNNLRTMFQLKSLRLAVIGIAFFTFVVAFMRAAVYMLGEAQNPRWDELKTSVVVGGVALGIGLGSPLAGYLSGKRVELRLVILGAIGMIIACCVGAYLIDDIPWLVGSIMMVGFFAGFYIVPLYTLLQHKSPKTSKGDMIATSNFVNILGAITASVLFFAVVFFAEQTGVVPEIRQRDAVTGILTEAQVVRGRIVYFELRTESDTTFVGGARQEVKPLSLRQVLYHVILDSRETTFIELGQGVVRDQQPPVTVYSYELAGVQHHEIVTRGGVPTPKYDQRHLPRYLFLGAAILTTLMLLAIGKPLSEVRKSV